MKTSNRDEAALKAGTLKHWEKNDFVVPDGEVIVLQSGHRAWLKRGDGKTKLSKLKFLDCAAAFGSKTQQTQQSQQNAKPLDAEPQSLVNGVGSEASFKSAASGMMCAARAPFSAALGFNAQTLSSDDFAFVWSGDSSKPLFFKHTSHGRGTFSIFPADGIDGVWIGGQTLRECIDEQVKSVVQPQVVYVKQTVDRNDGVEIAQVNRCPIYAPRASSAKISFKQDGKDVGSFTLDQCDDLAIELPSQHVPMGSSTRTECPDASIDYLIQQIASLSAQVEQLKSSIPSKTSQLKNDSRFVTAWSIGNGQLTFQKDGQTVAKFSANQASATVVQL